MCITEREMMESVITKIEVCVSAITERHITESVITEKEMKVCHRVR